MMQFLAGSMSHGDEAKLQVGYKNAKYHWPAFAGDTVKKMFTIKSLRSTSDNRNSLFTIECCLSNQKNMPIFTCDMTTIFPFAVPPSDVEIASNLPDESNNLLSHLINQAETLQSTGSQTLTSGKDSRSPLIITPIVL
jgi:hypothetical protein